MSLGVIRAYPQAFSPAAGANHRLTGVNFHKRSGKYDANVWITDQKRQEYLGSFEQPEVAAVARDVFILHLYFRDDQKVTIECVRVGVELVGPEIER